MVSLEKILYFQACGGNLKFKHTNKENKQTTKLQNWLDENGNGIPPDIIQYMIKELN
ncbi:MAG: hypothetical protein ACOCZ5_01885 [bacterium]